MRGGTAGEVDGEAIARDWTRLWGISRGPSLGYVGTRHVALSSHP